MRKSIAYLLFTVISLFSFNVLASGTSLNLSSIQALENMQATETTSVAAKLKGPRLDALKNAAYTLGAQAGFVAELKYLEKALKKHKNTLDNIFDFNTLLNICNHGEKHRYLLPPVIQKAVDAIDSNQKGAYIKISDVVYKIIRPAQLVTTTPTWQEYLLLDQKNLLINQPDAILLPKTTDERIFWKKQLVKGWNAGIQQAKLEMNKRILRLKRDYIGMVLFEKLYIKGLVDMPQIAASYQAVAGNTQTMHISQRVYQITSPARLDLNPQNWKPIPSE